MWVLIDVCMEETFCRAQWSGVKKMALRFG